MNFSTERKTFVMPIARMRPGTVFLPIVDEGREYTTKDRRGHLVKHHQRITLDRPHIKISASSTVSQDLVTARDAIFCFHNRGVVLVGFDGHLNSKVNGDG